MTASLVTHNGVAPHVTIPNIRIEIVTLTSEQAAEWLEKYKGPNRRTSDTKVLQFQSDMESGRWHFEGAPLRISKTNKLLDGKHRLTAHANCVPGVTLAYVVEYGLDDEAQLYMDQGQVRTTAQQLSLRGVPNSGLYASVSKLYLDWTRSRLFKSVTRGSTSKPEVTEWVLKNQALLENLGETKFQQIDAPPSVVGAFALAIIQIAPQRAFHFLEQLVSGAGLEEGNPILALDRRLRNIRRQGTRMSQREYLAYFIKAWNAWVMGDRLAKLQLNSLTEENFPELLQVADTV